MNVMAERWEPDLDFLARDAGFTIRAGEGWTEARVFCSDCMGYASASKVGESFIWWCPQCGRKLAVKGSVNLDGGAG